MKEGLTEIIMILDKSGSMDAQIGTTISSFNEFLDTQSKLPGDIKITTVLFSDNINIIDTTVDIKSATRLTTDNYIPHGMTAMLDAIGITVDSVGKRLSKTIEDERPSKILVVIITDGEENASKEYKINQIKEMITHQEQSYQWQFLFLGANIDVVSTASNIGVQHSVAYDSLSVDGVVSAYETMIKCVSNYVNTGSIISDK